MKFSVLLLLHFSWQVVHCVSSGDFDQSKGFERFANNKSSVPINATHCSSDKSEESSRGNRLNKVRKLFWRTYRLFSEETSPSSTRSLTGLLSKLATSVGMGGNSNT